MRKDIFSIPIFEDSVDLSKINISDEPTKPTWDSETPTTFILTLKFLIFGETYTRKQIIKNHIFIHIVNGVS